MNDNITFREFIKESAAFKCSKEYFDIVKEVSEIKLLDIYIDANKLIVENSELGIEIVNGVTDLLLESTGKETVEEAAPSKRSIGEMTKALLKKLWDAMVKALKFFLKPLFAIRNMIRQFIKKIRDRKNKKMVDKLLNDIEEQSKEYLPREQIDAVKNYLKKYFENYPASLEGKVQKNSAPMDGVGGADAIAKQLMNIGIPKEEAEQIGTLITSIQFNYVTMGNALVAYIDSSDKIDKVLKSIEDEIKGKGGKSTAREITEMISAMSFANQLKGEAVTVEQLEEYEKTLSEQIDHATMVIGLIKDTMTDDSIKINKNGKEILEGLVNLVGEMNIYSGRVVQALGGHAEEFEAKMELIDHITAVIKERR